MAQTTGDLVDRFAFLALEAGMFKAVVDEVYRSLRQPEPTNESKISVAEVYSHESFIRTLKCFDRVTDAWSNLLAAATAKLKADSTDSLGDAVIDYLLASTAMTCARDNRSITYTSSDSITETLATPHASVIVALWHCKTVVHGLLPAAYTYTKTDPSEYYLHLETEFSWGVVNDCAKALAPAVCLLEHYTDTSFHTCVLPPPR
jgi:hypothetical protein